MQPRSSAIAATTTATFAILLAGLSPARAQDPGCAASGAIGADAGAPCFAGVADILGGQRDLLRNDDLLVSVDQLSGDTSTFENYVFDTTLLKPANPPEKLTVAATDCANPTSGQAPLFTRLGRLYNLKNDVIVNDVLFEDSAGVCRQPLFVIDPGDGNALLHERGTFPSTEPRMALLDADLDGYDDILVMGFDPQFDHNFMQFYSPSDVDDPTEELMFRYQLELDAADGDDFTPRSDLVSGDFNGDGAKDVAWLGAAAGGEVEVRFASVCPAADLVVLGTTCSQPFEIVLSSESIDTGQTWTAASGTSGGRPFEDTFPRMGLAAGDFYGDPDPVTGIAADELVLIRTNLNEGDAFAFAYGFGAGLEPIVADPDGALLPGSDDFPVSMDFFNPVGRPPFVTSGRLDWAGRNEQVVVAASAYPHFGIWVLTFEVDASGELTITVADEVQEADLTNTQILGVAIGRFDPPDPELQPLDPPDQQDGPELDFNQQIAVLFTEDLASDGSDPQTLIDIYTVDPPDFRPTRQAPSRTVFLDAIPFSDAFPVAAPLQAGDLQGRSLRLGAPEKATVVHTQIDTVLGMPPMHVDYIAPPQESEPEVYNVSVFPDVFKTSYQFTDSQNSSATSTSTTSYTYSTKDTFDEKVSYGIPDIGGVSVSAKQAATRKHESTVKSQYNTYSGNTFTLDASTVFDDMVAFTTRRMNIYSYPVIGQMVCPAASPDCPADCGTGSSSCPELPMHVQFSGVDNVVAYKAPVAAGVLEWYQPVNEPGALFSYPGNLAQLEANQPQQQAQGSSATTPRLMLLSTPTEWSTSDDDTVALTWSTGSSGTNTVGSVSNHSFDDSASVAADFEIGDFGGGVSADFDYNSSKSVSTLNSNTLTLDESDGVTLDLQLAESTNPNPQQDYAGASYIFGLQAPVGLIQDDVEQASDVTLPATGPLQVASVADMTSTDPQSSDWWPVAYGDAPDVALNHPQRWTQTLPANPDPELVWFNCPIGFTSSSTSPNCSPSTLPASLDLPQTAAETHFYKIKGLFVTPGAASSGPPTTSATLGDTLTLRARIYNYSLANMPGGAEVHVAFYAQPWDGTGGQFLSAPGNPDAFAPAVLIDEVILAPIPAFCGGLQAGVDPCSEPDAPRNWAFAETTWDTSSLDAAEASYWKFWLATWMEHDGTLVAEIPGHGLTALPGSALTSFLDVPIETYSNNVGFYDQIFALLPPSSDADDAALAAPAVQKRPAAAKLRITRVQVPPQRRLRDPLPTVRATLRSNQALHDVMVRFFDGDPNDAGVLFDVEMIPHIAARTNVVVAVPYQPASCGGRKLFVEAVALNDPVPPAVRTSPTRIRGRRPC